MAIITIAGQAGNGGSAVAWRLADELGHGMEDREVVEEAAAEAFVDLDGAPMGDAGIDHDTATTVTRQITAKLSWMAREPLSMRETFEDSGTCWKPNWNPRRYAAILHAIIRRVVRRGHAMVPGRDANFSLEGQPDVIRVFVGGSVRRWAERPAADESLTPEFACDVVATSAVQHAGYLRKVCGREWPNPLGYDLVFDTNHVSDDEFIEPGLRRARELDPSTFPPGGRGADVKGRAELTRT